MPHPCGSARVGQIQGGFNRIGSIRGLSKPYPFNSITWKYKGVNTISKMIIKDPIDLNDQIG